jgi:hypothetical protein
MKKRLLFTVSALLCVAGAAAHAADRDVIRDFEKHVRQRRVDEARSGDEDTREFAYLFFTGQIRKGDSATQITEKLSPPWIAINTNKFIWEGFFSQWVPWTKRTHLVEWHSESSGHHGWPMIVFALFSDDRKTNLVDALLYNGGDGVQPLVDGPYSRKVLAIKPGETMEAVFKELGRRDCEYYIKDGKWRVRVTYRTCDGRFISYEAEAATGVILEVWDGTI